jgi:hypothetical protein
VSLWLILLVPQHVVAQREDSSRHAVAQDRECRVMRWWNVRWGNALGWLLAIPGLVVIACFALVVPLASWAGCIVSDTAVRCPATTPGQLAAAAGAVVAMTLALASSGVGLLPPIYSASWVTLRVARRVGWLWAGVLFVVAALVLRVAMG